MKKLILVVLLGLVMILGISVNSHLFARDASETTANININVAEVFEIAFYPRTDVDDQGVGFDPRKIRYPQGNIAFDTITTDMLGDPLNYAMIYTSEKANDGLDPQGDPEQRGDVGILCLSNAGVPWKLGIHMQSSTLTPDNFVVWTPEKAYYRNVEGTELIPYQIEGWHKMPLGTTLDPTLRVFTGSGDHVNTVPWGTLLTFDFAVVPSGSLTPEGATSPLCTGSPIQAATDHSVTIVYSMSDQGV